MDRRNVKSKKNMHKFVAQSGIVIRTPILEHHQNIIKLLRAGWVHMGNEISGFLNYGEKRVSLEWIDSDMTIRFLEGSLLFLSEVLSRVTGYMNVEQELRTYVSANIPEYKKLYDTIAIKNSALTEWIEQVRRDKRSEDVVGRNLIVAVRDLKRSIMDLHEALPNTVDEGVSRAVFVQRVFELRLQSLDYIISTLESLSERTAVPNTSI